MTDLSTEAKHVLGETAAPEVSPEIIAGLPGDSTLIFMCAHTASAP